jgi:hypothetical protein
MKPCNCRKNKRSLQTKRLWAPAESCSRKQCWFEYPNDGLCDQSIRADRKSEVGQTLVSINNSDLKAKKRQMLLFFRQPRDTMPRKITIVLWLYSSNKVPPKRMDDMTARYEMTKGTWKAKQMRSFGSLITLLLRLHFLSDQYLRERRRYGHPGMPQWVSKVLLN